VRIERQGDPGSSSFQFSVTGQGLNHLDFDLVEEGGFVLTRDGMPFDFGEGLVGTSTPLILFTLTNSGSQSLTGLAISLEGVNESDFTLDQSGSATELLPGGSKTFRISFMRSGGGIRGCGIRITSDDPFEIPSLFQLRGAGVTELSIAHMADLAALSGDSLDGLGHAVAISGDTMVVGVPGEDSAANSPNGDETDNTRVDSGAAFVFVRDGDGWSQQAYLKARNSGPLDGFGMSVAISGDVIVVGSPYEDSNAAGIDGSGSDNSLSSSGAAYVFVRSGMTWSQEAYVKASNPGVGDEFGIAVSVDGDLIAVGAQKEGSSAQGVNGAEADDSASEAGAVYVFQHDGSVWGQEAYLKASNSVSSLFFGSSLALSGDRLLIGAPGEDRDGSGGSLSDSGAAYIFLRDALGWSEEVYLKSSNPEAGDEFGAAASLSGDLAVVGAPGEDSAGTDVSTVEDVGIRENSGAAYVFARGVAGWSEEALLKASNTEAGDEFGRAVAAEGDFICVGASFEDSNASGINGDGVENSAERAGAVYLYERDGSGWSHEAYLKAAAPSAGGRFGHAVALSGYDLVSGIPGESGEAGAACVFDLNNLLPAEIVVENEIGEEFVSGASNLMFNRQIVGTASEAQLITIRNDGDLPLTGVSAILVGTNAADFNLDTSSLGTSLNGGESRIVPLQFAPMREGIRQGLILVSSSDADEPLIQILVTGESETPREAYDRVVAESGLVGADAEPKAEPFADNVANLLKYAFNMDLSTADVQRMSPGGDSGLPSGLMLSEEGSTFWRLEYVRRKGSGLVYSPQKSETLAVGTYEELTGSETITDLDDQWERVRIDEATDGVTSGGLFFRVEVELP